MKNAFYLSIICSSLLFFSACERSTQDVKTEVKKMLLEDFRGELKIKNFSLIHADGNEYAGFVETTDQGNMLISVVADKDQIIYEVVASN